jgi:hypothetical protein
VDEKKQEKTKVTNIINEHTGQFDARFLLWRKFCAENDVPIDSMPGDLKGEARQKWDQLKSEELDKK